MLKIYFSILIFLFCHIQIAQAETLKLVSLEQRPIIYTENGVIKGIATDIVREAFKRIHQPVTFEIYPFSRSLSMMKSKEADGLFAIVKTHEREMFMDYSSEPLIEQKAVLFVREKSHITFQGDLKQLSQYSFGILRGATYGQLWKDAIQRGYIHQIEEVTNYKQNIDKLLNHRIDILIGPYYTIADLIGHSGAIETITALSPAIESVPTYLAFAKDKVPLLIRQRFDQAIRELKAEGFIQNTILAYVGHIKS